MINQKFWKDKTVFLTGHTGFKGAWLSLWLTHMGAKVIGIALPPPTNPSLFDLARLDEIMESHFGDINDYILLSQLIQTSNPDIVIHMAAQPLVSESYRTPIETLYTNVIGTANLLQAVRAAVKNGCKIRSVVNVTTDKCYENKEWSWAYRENEPLGGKDIYSASKACAELITSSFRDSFFTNGPVGIATARAGNVIGGGDWTPDRLVPQCIESILGRQPITLRRPNAVRPWQHVLEPLGGYLLLAEKLYNEGQKYAEAWNFGPEESDCQPVNYIVHKMIELSGVPIEVNEYQELLFHEANLLKLDCSKAKAYLGWKPLWNLDKALEKVIYWVRDYHQQENMREKTLQQIEDYMSELNRKIGTNV